MDITAQHSLTQDIINSQAITGHGIKQLIYVFYQRASVSVWILQEHCVLSLLFSVLSLILSMLSFVLTPGLPFLINILHKDLNVNIPEHGSVEIFHVNLEKNLYSLDSD